MTKKQTPEVKLTVEDRLDIIIAHLQRMDKRDRLRTIGGFIKGVLGLIPLILMLASVWFVYVHGDELLKKIAQQAAEQAASFTQNSAGDLMQRINVMFPDGR
ncbi:hypothetical protein COU76_01800 [Candidatus Peregrinibacteria bacterium CG10_big_fil_rev_8_21_14_0_10_49_10]|nr:MAG: hypothetical protein COU76_01800 [Candidatus Peregrinibacteria bacterium CG10_big_fil_rev_8_21_14_0_10_49_10]